MLRISKMTDYGIVLLAHFARLPGRPVLSAREVAEANGVPLPTAAKLFRQLHRARLVDSVRGAGGGYALAGSPEEIDVARIVMVLEGPIALTGCSLPTDIQCDSEPVCPLRDHWPHINLAVRTALEQVTLADLIRPLPRRATASTPPALAPGK